MANPISWLLKKLFGLFSKLETETKEKIVDIIVEAFQGLFRRYFQQMRDQETNAEQAKTSGSNSNGASSGGRQ
ncbi:hypothetical protein [Vreelandella neptunia]|uniref:Uncharacterized protein n=1 Tax=Vreelandella neptunia TaxID=115551 RepID=A0ABZ0YKE4_9GAMM|nr:hypothetical protein [Halomonas neptunia]MDN3562713.1 hypothetical protein [Halomonas neptunia]WQH11750.1 hypothetical protein SR894_16530 [Halomonas neptunia]